MIRFALRRARLRFAAGLLVALGAFWCLPEQLDQRVWWTCAVLLGAPWLVLGRDAAREAEGWRVALVDAPRAGWLVMAELVPALALVALIACAGARFEWAPAVALFTWGAALVTVADALDRRLGRAGVAWVVVLTMGLLVCTAPLWLAPWFGEAPWTPWLASGAVALHPAGSALAAAGLPTLQDPLFYSLTLSGVVEARPMSWAWGAGFFGALALLGAAAAVLFGRRLSTPLSTLGR